MELPFTFLVSGFVKWLKIIVNDHKTLSEENVEIFLASSDHVLPYKKCKVKFTLKQDTKAQRGEEV